MCEAVSGGMGYMRNLYPPLNIAMNLKLPPKHKEKKKKKTKFDYAFSASKKFSDLFCLPSKALTLHGLVSKDFCSLASACLSSFMLHPSPPSLTCGKSVAPTACPGLLPFPLRSSCSGHWDLTGYFLSLILVPEPKCPIKAQFQGQGWGCIPGHLSTRLGLESSVNAGISLGEQEPHGCAESLSLPCRTTLKL